MNPDLSGYHPAPARLNPRVGPMLILTLLLGLLPPAPAQDTVILKNGRKAECQVVDFTDSAVKIRYQPAPGAAAQERPVPLAEVDFVELAPLPGEVEAMAQAISGGQPGPLLSFWAKRQIWLDRPRTNGGEIGLVYAELLTRTATQDRMERALKIYARIEASDWSAERRGRAQAGRLRVMLRQGRTAEVRPQAEALLEKTGDPRVLIELRHVMAEASAASLAHLEKDHPRWEQEDERVPEHHQFLNDAVEGYLYPHLFHGAEEDLAARGLWAASRLSEQQKNLEQAQDWAMDLTALYPGTPEASAARDWLAKQPPASVVTSTPEVGSKPIAGKSNASDEAGDQELESEDPDEAEAGEELDGQEAIVDASSVSAEEERPKSPDRKRKKAASKPEPSDTRPAAESPGAKSKQKTAGKSIRPPAKPAPMPETDG